MGVNSAMDHSPRECETLASILGTAIIREKSQTLCRPVTIAYWEVEARGSQVEGQPGKLNKTLAHKIKMGVEDAARQSTFQACTGLLG